MELIKDTIAAVLKRIQGGAICDDTSPEALLKKLLTKEELEHIKVQYFRRGILHAGVDSSSRLYSLSLRKDALVDRMRRENRDIKDIRLFIGEPR